jgi:hypothetical protein
MSEFEYKEESKAITGEVPRYSPADIQESDPSEVIEVSTDEMTVEEMWEFNQRVSEDDIKASALRDELVRSRYNESAVTIDSIKISAETHHDKVVADSLQSIEKRKIEYAEYEALERAKARLNIAAIEEQLQMNLQHADLDKEIRIVDLTNIIQDADKLLESNIRAIANLNREVEGAVKAQTQHEQRRSAAARAINGLIDEYEQKQIDLTESEKGLKTFQDALYKTEARRDELMDQKSELKSEERIERNALVEPTLLALRIENAFDDELPENVKELIKTKKQNATSAELSRILGELAEVQEEQKRNNRHLENNVALVAATELNIDQTNARLNEIPALIDYQRSLLATELEKIAADLERHSTDAVVVTQTFEAINKGDTTEVSKEALPPVLRPVWASMKSFQLAQTKSIEASQIANLPDPDYDESLLMPLLDHDAQTMGISDLAEMVENRETLSHDLEMINDVQFMGKIGRTVLKAGANIVYKTTGHDIRKD